MIPTPPHPPPRQDWSPFLDLSRSALIREYVDCATALANVIEEIAFLRVCELRDRETDKTVRIEQESVRDVLIEKKFLIARLLDHTHANGHG